MIDELPIADWRFGLQIADWIADCRLRLMTAD
jgi:hypothetical protein